jgi:hypothetical protein
MRNSLLFVGALVAGATLVGITSEDAFAAKKKKPAMTAKFDNKGFKANVKNSVVGSYTTVTHVLLLTGTTKIGGGLKTKIGQFSMTAGSVPDITNPEIYPVTLSGASGAYALGGLSGAAGWTTGSGMTIVLTKYDAVKKQLFGTFTGSMNPGTGASAALNITNGKFTVNLLVDGQ